MILFCHVGKWLVYNGNRNKDMMEVKIMNNMDIDKKVISDSNLEYVTGGVGMGTILNNNAQMKRTPDKLAPKNSPGGNDCFGALKNKEGENEGTGLA